MNTTAPWRITLLGALCVERGADVVTRFRSQKTAGLLGYLALYPQRPHTREELVDLFWPDAHLDAGRTNLRSALASLRRQLEPPGVEAGALLVTLGHSWVSLNRAAFQTDVAVFEGAVKAAASGEPMARAQQLAAAVEAYGGPLLPGRYEDWAVTERNRLAGLYLGALRGLGRCHGQAGDWERAADFARRAITVDPLDEEAHLDLLRLLATSGQAAAARRHFAEMEHLFDHELGIKPSEEAYALLLSASTVAVAAVPPVITAVAPPTTSVVTPPVSLPLTLTRFFGRDTEAAQIAAALRGPGGARLLTLTGPGGIGKTRLAIETALVLAPDFPGGIWFVPLAELWDASRFFETVATALRLPQTPAVPAREQVLAALQRQGEGGPVLLVLDNFEQIVDEGAAHAADLLTVPAVSCLVTSRRRLLLDGEDEMPVSPLPTPPSAEVTDLLMGFPSVQLFVARARAARPDFGLTERNAAAVAQLCRRLEGIPLALELAAAWAQTLSPAQMLERLARRFDLLVSRRRDVPGRHATLRATVEWSHQLLPDDLKRFFAGLSVFSGGWTLEAAEEVLGEPCALQFLAELQDRSLIVRSEAAHADPDAPPRFGMLETLREFAAAQVSVDERDRLLARHFDWCLRFAEEAQRHQRGPDQAQHLRHLEAERGNMRTALEYSLGSQDEGRRRDGSRLAAALGWFWMHRSLHREGREWLEAALAVGGDAESRILALHALGLILNFQSDYITAHSHFREALALSEAVEQEDHAIYSLFGMGLMGVNYPYSGEEEPFHLLFDAGAECARRSADRGDPWLIGISFFLQSFTAVYRGDIPTGRAHILKAIALFRELGDVWMTINSLTAQGVFGLFCLNADMAREGFQGMAVSSLEFGYGAGLFWVQCGLGSVAAWEGQGERAARLFGAAERHAASIHMVLPETCRPAWDRDVAAARAQAGDACFEAAWAEGHALTLEQAIALALS